MVLMGFLPCTNGSSLIRQASNVKREYHGAMQKPLTLSLFLVVALVFVGARAADLAPGEVTARNFAKLSLIGAKWQLQRSGFSREIVTKQMDCLKALELSKLAPMFAANLREHFNAAELRELDAFIASSAGQKVNKMGEIKFYTDKGEQAPEPMPELTTEESEVLMRFTLSEVGKRYSNTDLFVSKNSGEEASDRMAAVMAECVVDPLTEDPGTAPPEKPRPL
jgi:hypothetical protein